MITQIAAPSAGNRRIAISQGFSEYALLIMLALIIVIFTALNPRFLTVANFTALIEQNSPLFVISVGMTFAIISRNIDLSPGSMIALTATIIGMVFASTGSIIIGIIAGFAAAIAIELFNAVLIAKLGINPLIVTLAAWIWARGLAISLTNANSILIDDPLVTYLNTPLLFGISPLPFISALAFIVGWFLLNRTRLGRYTKAMGSDERATIQAGINTTRYKLLMFAMFGVLVGVASVISISQLGAATPDTATGLELDAIVAVIIGGNPFQGGEGRLQRTLVGAFFIAVLNNGLSILGMLDSQIALYKGAAILFVLLFGVVSVRLLRGKSSRES